MNEEIIDNVNRHLDEALERGRQLLDEEDLPQHFGELKERAEELIRQHPIKSITAGLLIGYIIGKVFKSED